VCGLCVRPTSTSSLLILSPLK